MKKVLTIAAVFVILAAGGWLAYAQTKDEPTQQMQNTSQQNNSTSADPSEGGKYLVIQEWGVRFLLPEEFRGQTTYKMIEGDAEIVSFNTSSVDIYDCAPVSLLRVKSANEQTVEDIMVGESRYRIIAGKQACDTANSPTQLEANSVQQKFKEALKTLENI